MGSPKDPQLDSFLSLPLPTKLKLIQWLRGVGDAPARIESTVGRETPQEFILEVLGERPTPAALKYGYKVPWTPDQELIMNSVVQHRQTAVQSGNSAGKTAILARIALWFLCRRPQTIVITTAPTKRQVEELLWGEIRGCFKSSKVPLPGRLLLASIKIAEKWYATGFTANAEAGDLNMSSFQGMHSPQMLALVDESTGTDPLIIPSIQGMLTGPDDRLAAIGNPTNITSWFYKACMEWESVIRMDSRDHPNVIHDDPRIIPGAATKFWVLDRRNEWGEDSPLYQAKVCGQWPEQNEDALIQLEWIERAKALYDLYEERGRPEEAEKRGAVLALDVAGEGGDLTVLSMIHGGVWNIPVLSSGPAWHIGRDVMTAVDLVMKAFDLNIPIRMIVLDDTGLGQGVTARLRQLQRDGKLPQFRVGDSAELQKPQIVPVNFGAAPWKPETFQMFRDELWWTAMETLRDGSVAIPNDHAQATWRLPKGNSLEGQLTTAIYSQDLHGRTMVLDKRSRSAGKAELTQNLPKKSPDVGHSFILACWGWRRMEHRLSLSAPPTKDFNEWWGNELRKMAIKGSKREPKRRRRHPWQEIPRYP